jgi:hypothetical protein
VTNTSAQLDRSYRLSLSRLWTKLIAAHDRVFTDANKSALKHLAIKLSIAGFAIHLLLIFLSRSLAHPPLLLAEVGRNYLTAISTPFSFILFYEVLTLIAALPASTTRSIANQFEIVSLIFIRDVFKDIANAGNLFAGHRLSQQAMPIIVDMWAALLMFLLVAVFQYVALQRVRPIGTVERSRGLEHFITQKKVVTIGLAILLLAMAAYNLGLVLLNTFRALQSGNGNALEIKTTYYNDLFTVMIFTDVLILILSLVVSGQYEMVFRNAAFVVSIILIRFSMTEEYPYGAPLAVLAMLFGVVTLLVFNFHMRIQNETPAG